MKTDYIFYSLFVLIGTLLGYASGDARGTSAAYAGAGAGLLLGLALAFFSGSLRRRRKIKRFCWGAVGCMAGLVAGTLVNALADPSLGLSPQAVLMWKALSLLFFAYMGTLLALRVEADPHIFSVREPIEGARTESLKILDTSVIIDGRIADLCETGFLEGAFITPQFILQELQHIADSSDSMKRARGRRGLDVLHRLQQMPDIEIRIVETDFPTIREVDSKIVALGKEINAKVITNDLNLNKVAELQGVRVLNINQLCNALKPVVLPGEVMRVFVLKEGKEAGQGIAYLDDGTMIVVDDARKSIGKTIQIIVTSVLQTPAGRMIFSRSRESEPSHGGGSTEAASDESRSQPTGSMVGKR